MSSDVYTLLYLYNITLTVSYITFHVSLWCLLRDGWVLCHCGIQTVQTEEQRRYEDVSPPDSHACRCAGLRGGSDDFRWGALLDLHIHPQTYREMYCLMQYFVFLFAGVIYSMYREYILKPHEAQKALEQKALEKKWREPC